MGVPQHKETTMKKWTVINQHDGNDTFRVEGDNYGEAACDALQQLGWAISIPESDEDEETPNKQMTQPETDGGKDG